MLQITKAFKHQQTVYQFVVSSFCLLFLFLSVGAEQAHSQKKKKKPKKTIVNRVLITPDGWSIPIVYYNSTEGQEAPVILLLHDRKQNRNIWTKKNGLAQKLQNEGYAVVAMDLRYHGDSKLGTKDIDKKRNESKFNKFDFKRMVLQDMETVKAFLYQKHQEKSLNIRKLGIVGIGMSGPLAAAYAVHDWSKPPFSDGPTFAQRTPRGQDVRSLVLISSDKSVSGLNTVKHLRLLSQQRGGIKFLIQYGSKDTENPDMEKIANKFYKSLGGKKNEEKENLYLVKYPSRHRGVELLETNKNAKTNLFVFLEKSLKELDGFSDVWIDRRSRYVRDDDRR